MLDVHTKDGIVFRVSYVFIAMFCLFSAPLVMSQTKQTVHVAASTTIKPLLDDICKAFQSETEFNCSLVAAPTGHLYAHIMHGANYDVLLSSNEDYVQGLINAEKVEKDSRFTLAEGRVVLWSADESLSGPILKKIISHENVQLAIPNPGSTPYGKAAKEVLQRYNLWHRKQEHITFGRNLGQTYTMIVNKQVKLGFISIAQLNKADRDSHRYWEPDFGTYQAVKHEAVVLGKSNAQEATQAFLKFLRSAQTCQIIDEAGYVCQKQQHA